jgi:hypothetical protein
MVYFPGESAHVPDEVAGEWIARGWAKKKTSAAVKGLGGGGDEGLLADRNGLTG